MVTTPSPLIFLEGPRRVGKTSFLTRMKKQNPSVQTFKENSFIYSSNIFGDLSPDLSSMFYGKDISILELLYAGFSLNKNHPLYIDRLFVSSIVYDHLYREFSPLRLKIERYKKLLESLRKKYQKSVHPSNWSILVMMHSDESIRKALSIERDRDDDKTYFNDTFESLSNENELFVIVASAFEDMFQVNYMDSLLLEEKAQ